MTDNAYLQTLFAQTETEELIKKVKNGLTTEALEIAITELASRGYGDADLIRLRNETTAPSNHAEDYESGLPKWVQKAILVVGGIAVALVISTPLKNTVPKTLIKLPVIIAIGYFWRKIDQKEREEKKLKNESIATNLQLTPLMVASAEGNVEEVARLLGNGADPNERNPDAATALMFAVRNQENKAVYLLIKAGADPMLKNAKGKSALDLATTSQRSEIQRIIA